MRAEAADGIFRVDTAQPVTIEASHRPVRIEEGASDKILDNLLTTEGDIAAEYRRRNNSHTYQSAHPVDVETLVAEGWELHKRGKTRVRLKQRKSHDIWLEDCVWALLRRMRYPQLNGKHFKLEYERPDGTKNSKQIDVFAKDDETVLVIECKSRATRGRKLLSKDLSETYYLQKPIADAVRRIYGRSFRPQIIWMYVTKNIIWSEPDLARADAINVRVVTENEFQYYDKFIRHMGPAGRYQFLAEFLRGKKIPGLEDIKIPAVRGRLGKHTFYSFVIPAKHLLKIAFVNHNALKSPGRTSRVSKNGFSKTDQRIRKIYTKRWVFSYEYSYKFCVRMQIRLTF